MITLAHTEMQVPTDRIHVTHLQDQADLRTGGWSADLYDGATKLGRIVDAGHASIAFHPAMHTARRILADFVDHCRDPHGEPLDERAVLQALAGERRGATYVANAERRGVFQVRFRTAYPDTWAVFWLRVPDTRPPDYEAAVTPARRVRPPSIAISTELWMGAERGWVQVRRNGSDEPSTPSRHR